MTASLRTNIAEQPEERIKRPDPRGRNEILCISPPAGN